MCGLAGVICSDPALTAEAWPALRGALAHRGPDDHGWLAVEPGGAMRIGRDEAPPQTARLLLAHRRLAILDPSADARQPMAAGAGVLAYNGEVYTFRELRRELERKGAAFRSDGDTEVVLEALRRWGADALPRLTGMFALAYLDGGRLLLARDPFGMKPLYLGRWRGGLAFASEIGPLLALPGARRDADATAAYRYLRHGLLDADDRTLFADVRHLPAGTWAEVDLHDPPDVVTPQAYERLAAPAKRSTNLPGAAKALRERLFENVRLHLRSDVPVALLLSGGLDSSALAAAVRHLHPDRPIRAFCFEAADPALSERRWAERVAEALRLDLEVVRPDRAALQRDLPALVRAQGQPFGSLSIHAQYAVLRRVREAGFPVVLSGQGADELLGGYPLCLSARLVGLVRAGRFGTATRFLRQAARLPGRSAASLLAGATYLGLPPALRTRLAPLAGEPDFPDWLHARWFEERITVEHEPASTGLTPLLVRMLTRDTLPAQLRYEDHNAMAHSVESRLPFLTTNLARFCLRLPDDLLIGPDATTKRVLREALRGLLPGDVLGRRDKVGFRAPEAVWLRGEADWVRDVLSGDTAQRIPALHLPDVEKTAEAILTGRRPIHTRLWRWLNLVLWTEAFDVRWR